jgi:hypothetical protein
MVLRMVQLMAVVGAGRNEGMATANVSLSLPGREVESLVIFRHQDFALAVPLDTCHCGQPEANLEANDTLRITAATAEVSASYVRQQSMMIAIADEVASLSQLLRLLVAEDARTRARKAAKINKVRASSSI